MPYTLDQILALAPDDASAKAAKGLLAPAKWPLLGQNDAAIWGECQGSGSKPYQTQIDLQGPAFRCSCPSRKFPCKHGLALFMLTVQQAGSFTANTPPAWVSEWLGGRQEKAAKQEAKAAAASEAGAKPVDEEAAAKREAKRSNRMMVGVDELERWLQDQVRQGISSLENAPDATWNTLAARMVDAQAPGLALRVRELANHSRGADWPARLLAGMGRLQLLLDAARRLEQLPASEAADVRYALGLSAAKEEVLASGEKLADDWSVLGLRIDERDNLWERRVWLLGRLSGRSTLLVDFAHGGARFADSWVCGSQQTATLAFYPGASPLRALLDPAQPRQPLPAPQPVFLPLNAALANVAQMIAANPWQSPLPLRLAAVCPVYREGRWQALDPEGRGLPLAIGDGEGWLLLALAGGEAVDLFGEWRSGRLAPLSAWRGGPLWTQGARL